MLKSSILTITNKQTNRFPDFDIYFDYDIPNCDKVQLVNRGWLLLLRTWSQIYLFRGPRCSVLISYFALESLGWLTVCICHCSCMCVDCYRVLSLDGVFKHYWQVLKWSFLLPDFGSTWYITLTSVLCHLLSRTLLAHCEYVLKMIFISLKQINTYPKKKLFAWFCKNVDNAMFFEELIFVLIFLLSLASNCRLFNSMKMSTIILHSCESFTTVNWTLCTAFWATTAHK